MNIGNIRNEKLKKKSRQINCRLFSNVVKIKELLCAIQAPEYHKLRAV